LTLSFSLKVTAVRQKKRAVVDSIKGQFGFLDYEVEEGKKLFFHMSEVQGNSYNLYPGDTVEFSIVTNHVCFYLFIFFFFTKP
jgi:cold shock CspA family protein